MNYIELVGGALIKASQIIFKDIIVFVPKFFLAFVVFVALMWISKVVSKLIGDLLRLARIDALLARIGITQAFHEVGFQVSIAYGVQVFIKWTLALMAFVTAFKIIGLDEVVYFLEFGLFNILPDILKLSIMFFLTVVIANKVKDVVSHTSYVAKNHSPFLANLSWFTVVLFGVIATLQEMDILRFVTDSASGIIQALGLGLALALGLAFGLGCKEEARCLLRSWMGKECYDLDCGCNTFGCGKCSGISDDSHEDSCECDHCNLS